MEIDPSFTSSTPNYHESLREGNNNGNNVCEETGSTYDNVGNSGAFYMNTYQTGNNYGDCARSVIEWDTSAIPDGSSISNIELSWSLTTTPPSYTKTKTPFALQAMRYVSKSMPCTHIPQLMKTTHEFQ